MPFEAVLKQIKDGEQEILQELIHSIESNTAVGIILKNSKELITTAVRRIEETVGNDYWVILKPNDLHGIPLERTHILLSAIERVIRFNVPYDDPRFKEKRRR